MQIHNFFQLVFFLIFFKAYFLFFFDKGFWFFKCGSIHNLSISAIMVQVRQNDSFSPGPANSKKVWPISVALTGPKLFCLFDMQVVLCKQLWSAVYIWKHQILVGHPEIWKFYTPQALLLKHFLNCWNAICPSNVNLNWKCVIYRDFCNIAAWTLFVKQYNRKITCFD